MKRNVYNNLTENQKQGMLDLMTPWERIQDAFHNVKGAVVKRINPDEYIEKPSPTFMKVVKDPYASAARKEMTFLERAKDMWTVNTFPDK